MNENRGVFSSAAVRQKLTIHETKLKKVFSKWAQVDETHETIDIDEWISMFAASGLVDAPPKAGRAEGLTRRQLRQAFVVAMLGEHEGAFDDWSAQAEPCRELIFPEFVDAIMRSALVKYASDPHTPVDLKVHELCLLLISGPAGAAAGVKMLAPHTERLFKGPALLGPSFPKLPA